MTPVDIVGIQLDEGTGVSVVLLGEVNETTRVLPIFIGPNEARAIAIALAHVSLPRPGTHDLLADVLTTCEGHLDEVRVTGLVDGVFLAELVLTTPTGIRKVESRPSDGIALALRLDAPIVADHELLDEAAVAVRPTEGEELTAAEIDEAVEEFHKFLSTAEPHHFGAEASGEPTSEDE